MANIETYVNQFEQECVIITNEDGTTWAGLKSVYDEQQATLTETTKVTK